MAGAGLPPKGGRACLDAGHANDLGGDHRHVRGSEQGIFCARNIATGGVERQILMAENNTGQRLDPHVFHAVALDLGKVAHLAYAGSSGVGS